MTTALPYSYFHCTAPQAKNIEDAVLILEQEFEEKLKQQNVSVSDVFCIRFFCSDVHRQAQTIRRLWKQKENSLLLFIGQPPLDSRFVSMQVCLAPNCSIAKKDENTVQLKHNSYRTVFSLFMPQTTANSEKQSDKIIEDMKKLLKEQAMTLEENVIRTWYYIRDVDNNYAGMVKSRVRYYEECSLTPKTHFIASTGIEACAENPHVLSWVIAEAQEGLQKEQITYLKALSHLSPTHVYGVNFERATAIDYGNCRHIRISGTASIDSEGHVVHIGNPLKQAERAIENISELLREGGLKLTDLQSVIIYLRDAHDYEQVKGYLSNVLPKHCARNFVVGPVCRPDWLVEIEGEALAPFSQPDWNNL